MSAAHIVCSAVIGSIMERFINDQKSFEGVDRRCGGSCCSRRVGRGIPQAVRPVRSRLVGWLVGWLIDLLNSCGGRGDDGACGVSGSSSYQSRTVSVIKYI